MDNPVVDPFAVASDQIGGLLSEALKNEMFNIIFLNSHTYPKLLN